MQPGPPSYTELRGADVGVPVRTAVLQRHKEEGIQGIGSGHAVDPRNSQRCQRERVGDGPGVGESARWGWRRRGRW